MIRIIKTATNRAEVNWDTGMEFQFLKLLKKLAEERNTLQNKKDDLMEMVQQ